MGSGPHLRIDIREWGSPNRVSLTGQNVMMQTFSANSASERLVCLDEINSYRFSLATRFEVLDALRSDESWTSFWQISPTTIQIQVKLYNFVKKNTKCPATKKVPTANEELGNGWIGRSYTFSWSTTMIGCRDVKFWRRYCRVCLFFEAFLKSSLFWPLKWQREAVSACWYMRILFYRFDWLLKFRRTHRPIMGPSPIDRARCRDLDHVFDWPPTGSDAKLLAI